MRSFFALKSAVPTLPQAAKTRKSGSITDGQRLYGMPVIIAEEDYGRWLDPEFFGHQELERMMQPFEAAEFQVMPAHE